MATKLYLSSIGVPNQKALLELLPKNAKLSVAIIPNAWDVYSNDRRIQEIDNTQKTFKKLGFETKIVDLKNINGSKLEEELAKHSLVWVMGGNSFYLNYHIHGSGMAGFIKELLENGLVYGGESAGAVVACLTLHGVEILDDPKEAPKIIWEGMSLVDFGIVPHWGMEKYAEELQKCKDKMEKYVKVRTLTNYQAMVVDESQVMLVEKVQK